MPFKLEDVSKKPPVARNVADGTLTTRPQEKAAVSAPQSQPAPTTQEQAKARISRREYGDSLPLPFQISHFVIFRTPSGSVSMKQCSTEAAAKEYKEKLENGYKGN